MDASTRATYDSQRDFSTKAFSAGCYAPFVSLYFNTVGDVVACCRSQAVVLGNASRDRLGDIWNGPKMAGMREALADYRFENGCEFCEWMIQGGDHQGATANAFESYSVETQTPQFPKRLEFAMSNTCNFACIQCCGDWSSTIRAHRERLPALPRYYGDSFFEDLREYLPHVEQIKFSGGEPFLAQENYRVWDMLIEDGLKPRCHVLTNGSQWNNKVERVLDGLDFAVAISLDAITSKDAFDKIRINGKFDDVITNFHRFRKYTRERGKVMGISFSWMRQNWSELGPMLAFADEHDTEVHVIRVIDPPQFSLFSLPVNELKQIADDMEKQGREILPRLTKLRDTWLQAIASLRENATARQAQGYREVQTSTRELRHNCRDIARTHLKAGQWDEAAKAALETDEQHKEFIWALLIAAHARRREGSFVLAEGLLDRARDKAHRLPAVFVERAWLRFDQERYDEGVTEALRAKELAEGFDESAVANALHVLAFAYASLNKEEQLTDAIAQWRLAAPNDANAETQIAQVQRRAERVRGSA